MKILLEQLTHDNYMDALSISWDDIPEEFGRAYPKRKRQDKMVRKTTKEILAESFMELTATKPISKISIVDIVENCAMTKPMFYRYFKDK